MLRAAKLYKELGSTNRVARELGVAGVTVMRWLDKLDIPRDGKHGWVQKLRQQPKTEAKLPDFPDDDITADEIIALQKKRFAIRKASHDAHTWFPIEMSDDAPIGLLWFGDPHVDDDGCNWPVLSAHCDLCARTPGLWGANVGDTTNNWQGRLLKKYADQNASIKTARKLARWLMLESGVRWLIWLLGNHDTWNDGAEILAQMARQHNTRKIICHDWEARFTLNFPNGWAPRVHTAHDFPGNSQWNPLHGPMKQGQMGDHADLFVCGDKHNAAHFAFENALRANVFQQFIRVRGYKFMDDYARHLGKPEQEGGCGILTIFDPQRRTISAHFDVELGANYLTYLRGCYYETNILRPVPKDKAHQTKNPNSSKRRRGGR